MATRILIIDDMADFRLLVRTLLEAEIADVNIDELEGAGDPERINGILKANYDLILLDYQLQGHDGLSVQRDLRKAGCNTPVILLTAHGNEKLAVQAIKEGAYDYLAKTRLDPTSLIKSVQGALATPTESDTSQARFGDNIQVQGYHPVKLLGRGAYSMVYLAESEQGNKQVVLKLLIVSNVGETDIERFMREYEIMADLAHKNIGKIYDQAFTEEVIFMLMEHLQGGTLKQKIAERKRFPENETIALMIQLFSALHYIHESGILHRDIKPANILFRDASTPVIVDFGIASQLDEGETLTDKGSVVGTPAYMSPEQAIGNIATQQSDLYSMGIVLYEMLTGKKPFEGQTPHQTMYRVVNDKLPILPPEHMHLQEIMDMLLAKHPDQRFTSGKEVADVLRHVQQS